MASTYTDRLGFEKQATGENLSSWGERLNGALELIDEAIAGVVEISLTGNKTLSATINVSNENRQSALFFTDGGLASSPTVTVANEENWWFVRNGTGFAITFTAGGDTATIADGNIAVVICDGTDCIAWDPAALAETYAANLEEDWQIERWGEDEEAAERRAHRRDSFLAARDFAQTLD